MNGINDDTFSPSELIYLYLDGEADAAQYTVLFAALAHDPELQTEFQDALQMRLSLATEVRQTLPPPSLKEALLQKATTISQSAAQAAAGATVAPATSATAGSMFAAVQSVLIPLLSAVAGTMIVANTVFTPTHSPVEPTGSVVTSVQQEPPVAHSLAPDSSAALDQSGVVEHNVSASLLRTSEPVSVQRTMRPESAPSRNGIVQNDTSVEEKLPDAELAMQEEYPPVLLVVPLAARYGTTTEADYQMPTISLVQEPLLFAQADNTHHWTVYSRGIVGVRLFPWRSPKSTGDFASDLAVGVLYSFNEEFAAGIEAGQETLPLYVVANGGILDQRLTIQWAGATGHYAPENFTLPGNIQPFITGIVGATGFGPIAKSILGVRWQPDTHIGLALGIEGTTLFYRYQQQWQSTQKIGVTYGVDVQF